MGNIFDEACLYNALQLGPDRYIGWLIISADIGSSQMYRYWHIIHQYRSVFRLEKGCSSDIKWYNYVVLLFNTLKVGIKYVRCKISCLHYISLSVLDNHIQTIWYLYNIRQYLSDTVIFLLPNIGIGIRPKNSISVGSY